MKRVLSRRRTWTSTCGVVPPSAVVRRARRPHGHGERQDHVRVLASFEGVADQVRNAPDEADDLAVDHVSSVPNVITGCVAVEPHAPDSRGVGSRKISAIGSPQSGRRRGGPLCWAVLYGVWL